LGMGMGTSRGEGLLGQEEVLLGDYSGGNSDED
jgi:hypothetical protein